VPVKPAHVCRLSRKIGRVWVPKAGWVRFRWSRAVPEDVKSYRVTMDRAGRWHIAFAAIPAPVQAPGNGRTVGIDRGVTVSAALSTGDRLHVPGLTWQEKTKLRRLERKLARAKRGSRRRGKVRLAIARLRARETDRRKDWVDAKSRKSQARFVCTACGYACHADVNAARNIAAGHAVTARGGFRSAGPANREPQLLPSFTGCE
jgi:transposase